MMRYISLINYFSDISFSQGSVAMRLRCGWKFNNSFIANFQQIATLEEFWNRPVFDEVMPKILLVHFFSRHSVINACVINVFAGHLILCPTKFGLSHAYIFTKLNHETQNKDTQETRFLENTMVHCGSPLPYLHQHHSTQSTVRLTLVLRLCSCLWTLVLPLTLSIITY